MLEKEQMILLPHHHSLSALVPHQEAEDLKKKNSQNVIRIQMFVITQEVKITNSTKQGRS
jgi:hypothetical protein